MKKLIIKSGNPYPYLTKGKAYNAKQASSGGNLWEIVNDNGGLSLIALKDCAHLQGGTWEFYNPLKTLLGNANLSRLSIALGKHRSYLNKMIQQGVSNKTYNKIKDKLTIDWNSDKALHVNDGKHVPFTIKPINCKQQKHKDWLQSLMMSGCVKL